ncbi:MAG TPA: TonB-dependent receptor [Ferruginibacter sp.]|nr:TonB-dependent receptor [Ferruginibacter sp.]
MRKNIKPLIALAALFNTQPLFAQQDSGKTKDLNEVIITGQYKPQSIKNSVYQVRVINSERIRLSGATKVQQVLNNQLGFRFSNDNALGITDVQLMGMNGRNVKILLDGVPMVDRGDTRESLNQVDINTIDRIEIVDGPMSVSYGSDALAGVINIITKKFSKNSFSIVAKAQEETTGKEYHLFNYKGVHTQNISTSYSKNNWGLTIGGTHNDADGFGGDAYGRDKAWKPKEQWLGNIKLGYSNGKFNIYYRVDGLNETIVSRGPIAQNYKAKDQKYITDRFMQQLQGDLWLSNKLQLASIVSYTDYKRKTKTSIHDFQKNTDELSLLAGEQDQAKLNSFVFRNTFSYQVSEKVSLQPGIDINSESASGERISGNKTITDFALFVSSEIKPTTAISIRPGLRFIKNSVYDAPPVVPSLNSKFKLSKELDLRLSYGYGFRSPALRELYFSFVDVNHNLVGNPNLEAEYSNSFNGSLSWSPSHLSSIKLSTTLGGFYNDFNNQISLVQNPSNPNEYSYYNIDRSKTTGVSLDNRVIYKNLEASLGFVYTAYSASIYEDKSYIKEDKRDFLWTPELNSNIIYNITMIKTSLGFFYKFVGTKPAFVTGTLNNQPAVILTKTSSYHLADLTATTILNKYISTSIGVKNLFDVTNVANSAVSSGIHSGSGARAIGYGRSYFVGLNLQWNKK